MLLSFPRIVLGLSVCVLGFIALTISPLTGQLHSWNLWPTQIVIPEEVVTNPYGDEFLQRVQQTCTATLVIGKLQAENASWIEDELSDVPNLKHVTYIVDGEGALLQVPANKGNEAMVYLSYIIDFYDNLPDVSIFMHAHRSTGRNNELLDHGSSAETVRRLSLEKVDREGYANLRCHQDPGCPGHLDLHDPKKNINTYITTNHMVAVAFGELFPHDKLPRTLSQPCCAQFAASRAAIQRRPKEDYMAMRKWLINTDLGNQWSGRIFEYSWHYIFTAATVFCPSVHLCYCDAYSVCFPSAASWQQYQDILSVMQAFEVELGPLEADMERHDEVQRTIGGLRAEADQRMKDAFLIGSNAQAKQKVLYDAWELLKVDGLVG